MESKEGRREEVEEIIMIAAMAVGVIVAFLVGYRVGKDSGFVDGMDAAIESLKEIYEQGEEEIKRIEKEINPDCGWK